MSISRPARHLANPKCANQVRLFLHYNARNWLLSVATQNHSGYMDLPFTFRNTILGEIVGRPENRGLPRDMLWSVVRLCSSVEDMLFKVQRHFLTFAVPLFPLFG